MKLVESEYNGPRAATLGCPSPDVLVALGGEALPDDLRAAAEAHVATCAACQALRADLDAIDVEPTSALDQRVAGGGRRASAGRWTSVLMAMAAVLVAAVGLGVWLRLERSDAPALATAKTPADDPAQGSAVEPRPGGWEVRKPALLLPLATALVVRGEEEAAARALGEALAPYRTDDYPDAERRLEDVVKGHPSSADAWFYLGATRLLKGDPLGARGALAEARRRGVGDRDDEAAWLLATAEARSGAIDEARNRLTTLCEGTGAFKIAACNARESLR